MIQQRAFLLSGLGILQFFVVTLLCMFLYSGGTILQPELDVYSFTSNFFSDLGRTRTFTDQPNTLVFVLFTTTVVLAGLATVLFSVMFPTLFKGTKQYTAAIVGAGFGVLSGLCYVGVGLTPWDVFFDPHILFVKVGFLSFLIGSLFIGYTMYRSAEYNNMYVWVYLVFICILIGYLYLLFFGPKDIKSAESIMTQVIAQKILLYSQMLTMLVQCYGAHQFSDKRAQK